MASPALDPAFTAWLAAAGVRTSPAIQVVTSPAAGGGRAVVAIAPIQPGDELVSLPSTALLSTLTARADPPFAAALAAETAASSSSPLSDEAILAAYLLTQAAAGPASPWAPFIATLPRSYPLLAAWGDEDGAAAVAALACPAAVATARSEAAAADRDASAAARLVRRVVGEEGPWATRAAYLWAAGAVRSRSMFLSPSSPAGALVPFGDLFNHGCPPTGAEPDTGGGCGGCAGWHGARPGVCPGGGGGAAPPALTPPPPPPGTVAPAADVAGACWGDGAWDAASRTYTLTARAAYAPGQEVRLCYGAHTNLALLAHYGFCLPDGSNPGDTARIQAGDLPPGLLDGEAAPEGGQGWAVHASGTPGWRLLAALRRAAVGRVGGGKGKGATAATPGAAAAAIAEGRAASAASDAAALGALARAAAAAAARLEKGGEAAAAAAPPSSPSSLWALADAWRGGQVAILRRAAAQARRAAEAAADVAVRGE